MFPLLILCWLLVLPAARGIYTSLSGGRKSIGQVRWELEEKIVHATTHDFDPSLLYSAHNFSTPIDHFHNESRYEPHSDDFFSMRYWFDASYYRPGGPVIVLQSGETDAASRLPFLQKGILHKLIKATHGIGVVMEHRYYGTSIPTPDLSTENLRFLSTEQALADAAYFAQHIRFPGLEKYGDLTSETTAYIGYGGSYAGAFNAFLRVQYPDVYWGAISSSGVTVAIYDYWQYFEPIRESGPPECIDAQQKLTHVVDNILLGLGGSSADEETLLELKSVFGLLGVTHDDDFASVLAYGISAWQSQNWDPAVGSHEVMNYCSNISATAVLYRETEVLRKNATHLIAAGGYTPDSAFTNQLLNYVGYVNLTAVSRCARANATQDQCFSRHNSTFFQQNDLTQFWRSWSYQYCTEWGYLQTGSGVPTSQLPLVSRKIDLDYEMIVCNEAFGIHEPANVTTVNKYGGYNISYPRLAFIDGDRDPWRPATPHGFGYGAVDRKSTISEPFVLIENAVHHYDENGLFANETTQALPPKPVAEAQEYEVQFVLEWMREWEREGARRHRVDWNSEQQLPWMK